MKHTRKIKRSRRHLVAGAVATLLLLCTGVVIILIWATSTGISSNAKLIILIIGLVALTVGAVCYTQAVAEELAPYFTKEVRAFHDLVKNFIKLARHLRGDSPIEDWMASLRIKEVIDDNIALNYRDEFHEDARRYATFMDTNDTGILYKNRLTLLRDVIDNSENGTPIHVIDANFRKALLREFIL